MEELIFILLPFIVFAGWVLGLMAFFKLKTLGSRLQRLERKLEILELKQNATDVDVTTTADDSDEPLSADKVPAASEDELTATQTAAPESHDSPAEPAPADDMGWGTGMKPAKLPFDWEKLLRQHWMVILGGICLVFAGIFLVRYSIDHGLLGPAARIAVGTVFGIILIAAGEKLRRSSRLEAGVHAALVASGALVTYSALLVGYTFYHLYSAQTAFAAMAVLSAGSMLLALKHGPMVAGLGMLGAYVVPVLVSTGSNNIEAALLYSFIVTCSAFWLQRYIYRPWLWWGSWAGAIGWLMISLDMPSQAQGLRTLYLAALAYSSMALTFTGFRLTALDLPLLATDDGNKRDAAKQIITVFGMLAAASLLVLRNEIPDTLSYPALALLPVIASAITRHNLPALRLLPGISLLPIVAELFSVNAGFVDWQITLEPLQTELQLPYIAMLLLTVAGFIVIAVPEVVYRRHPGYWAAFVLFVPLGAIILGYIRIAGLQQGEAWSFPTLLLAGVYAWLIKLSRDRNFSREVEAAAAIATQSAIAIASFLLFAEVTLTLILAVQLIGLAFVDRKLHVAAIPVAIKLMLMIVLLRLTLNPWIVLYDVSGLTLLLTYIGCLFACIVAARELDQRPQLLVWMHSAIAHLIVLTLAVMTRYMLYGGDIFARQFTLAESSIYICSWAAIGLIYDWKTRNMQHYRRWYRALAFTHMFAAALLYAFYNLVLHNPLWSVESIGTTPVFNLLLIAYGLPVVLAALIYKRIASARHAAGLLALVGLYMFATVEIRHLWHGTVKPLLPVSNGELYTYSLVWLLLSVAIMVYGVLKSSKPAQQAGGVALMLVIAKVFLWDMRDLEGLWRVVSFLGLGLALLGIAYLFGRIRSASGAQTPGS